MKNNFTTPTNMNIIPTKKKNAMAMLGSPFFGTVLYKIAEYTDINAPMMI